jgi:hypothetical protein
MKIQVYCSLTSRRRRTADLTDAAAVVLYTHAPPATVRLHLLHAQMPTQVRFMASCERRKSGMSCCVTAKDIDSGHLFIHHINKQHKVHKLLRDI